MNVSHRGSLEGIFTPIKVELPPTEPEIRVESNQATTTPAPTTPKDAHPANTQHDTIRNVAVYLPVALRDALRDHARKQGLTITQVVEEAFAEHGANYSELVGASSSTPGSMPTRVSVRRAGATIQVQLRLNGRQHQWLDTQVESYEAPNRSALVTAVLDRHLRSS